MSPRLKQVLVYVFLCSILAVLVFLLWNQRGKIPWFFFVIGGAGFLLKVAGRGGSKSSLQKPPSKLFVLSH